LKTNELRKKKKLKFNTMKKILGLAFGLMIGAFSYGQSAATFSENVSNYDKATTTAFHFNLDQSITADAINDNAVYYTDYFTVAATDNNGGHDITITLAQDDEMSRKVIQRYFVSMQVQTISVDGTDVQVLDFMNTYIIK
jgi:hypothetical protein